jgi:putative ABC transport system permease protein
MVLAALRFAARLLRRSPGFSLTVVGVLTLGISSITAIFSVVNKVLLEPLPYPDPDRLVQLIASSQLGDQPVASIPKYIVWRDHTTAFEEMAAYEIGSQTVNLAGGSSLETVKAMRVSAGVFSLFGAKAAIGRTFSSLEDRPAGPHSVVISTALWRRLFAA